MSLCTRCLAPSPILHRCSTSNFLPGGDTMCKAMVSFFRSRLNDQEEDSVLVETFRCVPRSAKGELRRKLGSICLGLSICPEPVSTVDQLSHSLPRLLPLVKTWMTQCRDFHEHCRSHDTSDWYPTRLLKIGGNPPKVKLILSQDQIQLGPYASMSHCWGKTKILRLLVDNLAAFKSSIVLSEHRKTFQDAKYCTLSLGIDLV